MRAAVPANVGGVYLTRLALTDFRSYAAAEVTLGPGVTTFTGANGQGKTNLVEAACYVAAFASHRVATDAPLIRQGAERAILRAGIRSAGRDSLVEIEINAGRANRVRLNRAPAPRPREVLGVLRCVLFAPEDLTMVKGDPDQRRRFLDDLLVASAPRYAGVRADYERVIRQRNALLKSAKTHGRVPPGALEVWDDHLVATGAELTAARLRLVAELRPLVATCYSAVSGTERDTAMTYRMSATRQAGFDDGEAAGQEPEAEPSKLAGLLRDAAGRPPPGRDRARDQPRRAASGRARAADRRHARAGIRQPRRVVVARPVAAAGVLRAPASRRRGPGAGSG